MSNAQVDSGIDKLRVAGRNLWLAGLGAVAEVEDGGRELFDRLVERGLPVEDRQKKLAGTVTERANKAVRSLGKRVEETVEFEGRGMLKRLNLMTREDVKLLSARLATLSKKLHDYAVRHEAAAQENHEILNATAVETNAASARPRSARTARTTKTAPAAKASRAKKG